MKRAVFAIACLAAGGATADDAPTDGAPVDGADDLPLWELGVGGFVWAGPDYPGSGQYSVKGLPFPLIVYRGDFFRLGEDSAVRVVPVDTPRYEIGISADGAFGAESDDDGPRAGMPDLDPLLQLGPEVVIRGPRFDLSGLGRGSVDVALQARAVFSIDTDDYRIQSRGFVGQPVVRYRQKGLLGGKSTFQAEIGPVFATEKLHDFFYDVDSRFARAGRPAFSADGGYLGTEIGFDLAYALTDRWNLFSGVDLSLHHGAANTDSPLFEDRFGAAVFFGATYAIAQSDERVKRNDD